MTDNPTTGGNATRDIVAKLRGLYHGLRDDGITYNESVTELTFLLFLKMMRETGHEHRLPNGYRWGELARREGLEQLDYYRRLPMDLGDVKKTADPFILAIFSDAATSLRKPAPGLIHHSDRESQGQLLRQCPDRKLVQQLQERADLRRALRHPRGHGGHRLRVHRGVLQPYASAFQPRLHVPGAVTEGLD